MAKYYFRLILLLAAVVGFFAIIGSLLPRSYDFSTSIDVTAAPGDVFPEINTLKNWQNWSRQWNPAEIEGLKMQYNAEASGVGAAQSWTDIRGDGKLWITQSDPDKSIEYKMTFAGFPEMVSTIVLTPSGEQTTVTWSSKGTLPGGPFYGYFGSFFSTQMKAEYDKSLEKLKTLVDGDSTEDEIAPADD